MALADLRDFISFQSSVNAKSDFSFEPDYFGHSARVPSARHRDSFLRGQKLAQNPIVDRFIFTEENITYFASSDTIKFLENLIQQNLIENTHAGWRRRLRQLLGVHKEMLVVSDPEVWDEEEQNVSAMDFYWHCTSFYRLIPLHEINGSRQEEWRKGRDANEEKERFSYYKCTCPKYVRTAFCKHSFALALLNAKCPVPLCRSIEVVGSTPTRGRPQLSTIMHR